MGALTIREAIWQDFVELAKRQRRKPEALAERVLRDYVRRIEDEELFEESSREARRHARRTGLRMRDVEEAIRQLRRDRAKRETRNGGTARENARRS